MKRQSDFPSARTMMSRVPRLVLTLALSAPACGTQGSSPESEAAPRSEEALGLNTQSPLPHSLYLGDVDGDGVDDFIQLSGNRIFVTGTDANYTGKLHYYLPATASQLVVGNFSGGSNSQICAVLSTGSLQCYARSDDGTTLWWWFQQPNFISSAQKVIVADLDGNGTDDLLLYNPSTGAMNAYTQTNGAFSTIPSFSVGNLASVAKPNMRFFNIRSGKKSAGFLVVDPTGMLSWFFSTFDGTNHTFWWAFNTASGFVPAGYDVSTARIDDDTTDDVILHSSTGSFLFYQVAQSGSGLRPITNVSVGQLDTHDTGTKVFWGKFMPNLNEPGGTNRDGALVYEPSTNWFVRSDGRWDGSHLTYWWTYNETAPGNDVGWPAVHNDKWLVLLCDYKGNADTNQPASFFQKLFSAPGVAQNGMVDYFRDISYGTVDVSTTQVAGWYTEAVTQAQDTTNCDRNCALQHCVQGAPANVNVASYGWKVITVTNEHTGQSGNVDGANTGVAVDSWGYFPDFLGHEMLHSYGLSHSFGPACGVNANPGEYCDSADIMSALATQQFTSTFPGPNVPGSGPNLNMAYKDRLGWIPANRRWVVTSPASKTQTVTLASSNKPEANGSLLAKVQIAGAQFYTVEYRTKEGWDLGLSSAGVFVHLYNNAPQGGETVGDSVVQTSSNGHQSMQPGDQFTGGGVTVKILSFNAAAGTASVSIQY